LSETCTVLPEHVWNDPGAPRVRCVPPSFAGAAGRKGWGSGGLSGSGGPSDLGGPSSSSSRLLSGKSGSRGTSPMGSCAKGPAPASSPLSSEPEEVDEDDSASLSSMVGQRNQGAVGSQWKSSCWPEWGKGAKNEQSVVGQSGSRSCRRRHNGTGERRDRSKDER
jgi:hypothetical protein